MEAVSIKSVFIPSFNEFRGRACTRGCQGLMSIALINALWHLCHRQLVQTAVSGAFVIGFRISADATLKGLVADNVAETRNLVRDVRGNLQNTLEVLKETRATNHTLKATSADLSQQVKHLTQTINTLDKTFQQRTDELKDVTDELKGVTDKLKGAGEETAALIAAAAANFMATVQGGNPATPLQQDQETPRAGQDKNRE